MKKLVFTLLAVSFLTGIAAAEYSLKSNVTLDMKQSVNGEGYFVTYKHARMPNTMGNAASTGVEILDYGHGSGNINLNSVMLAQSSNRSEGDVKDAAMDYQEALSCIQLKENNSIAYSPVSIGMGVGYYAADGLNYNSSLKDKTWLKNRDGSATMNHEVEYAHATCRIIKKYMKRRVG
jgi:microcystin degradation protein MlrC